MSQNKKFRKFAAASLAATATVVAVAPAVAAAQFDDVTENNVHADNISKLVEAGVITGYPNGEFRPAESIERRHVALMLYRQFELEAPADVEAVLADYTDVSSDDIYADEIAAVIEAGFFKGSNGEFMPTENISREQMASVLVRAFNLEDNGVDVDVYLDNVDPSHQASVKILAQHGLTTQLDNFRPKEDVQRGQFASFIVRTVEATAAPAVESVSAINAREIVVTFNKVVDKTQAEDDTNYTLVGETITSAKLSEDGKSVTLTSSDEIAVASAKFTVAEIATAKDTNVKTAEYNTLLTFTDVTAPSIASIEAKGTEAVITFDEHLSSEGTVSLDGVELTSGGVDYTLVDKTLTITGLTEEQSYRVDIVGAVDFAGNVANPIEANFKVAKVIADTTKPTVTSTIDNTTITLDFSEELQKQDLDGAAGLDEYAKVTVGTFEYYLTDAEQDSEDKTKFTLDAATALGTQTFINTTVKVESFQDVASNTGDAYSFSATLREDTTAPQYVGVTSKILVVDDSTVTTDEDVVYLTFNEEVTVNGDFTLKSKNGIVYSAATPVTLTAVASGEDVDGNGKVEGNEKFTVAVPVDLDKNSSYTFELEAGSVADSNSNVISDAITVEFTTGSYSAPTGTVTDSLEFNGVSVTNNKQFVLEYKTEVSTSALQVSNYTLGGKALPSGTVLQYVDGTQKVRFTLPEGSIKANGTYILKATNVVDTAGNTLKGGDEVASLTLKENVSPTASSLTLLDSKNISVSFTENISNAVPTGVTLKINGATITPANSQVTNGKLVLTTTNDFALTDNVSVEFKSTNLADSNGNTVKDGVVTK